MSIGENEERSRTESRDEETGGQGPRGTTQPATPYAEEETHRTGSKVDIRSTGGEAGDSAPPPDKLRNGT